MSLRRVWSVSLVLAVLLAAGVGGSGSADTAYAATHTYSRSTSTLNAKVASCLKAKRVWVEVQRRDGSMAGGCASSFKTGLDALKSAGFAAKTSGGFVNQIDKSPAKVPATFNGWYWSFWHWEPTSTGKYAWSYSGSGAAAYKPKAGSLEAWRYSLGAKPTWTPAIQTIISRAIAKKPSSIRKSKTATITVTVKAADTTPTGKVTVKVAGRSGSANLNARGVATVKVTKITKTGTHSVAVTYSGSALVKGSATKTTLKVTT